MKKNRKFELIVLFASMVILAGCGTDTTVNTIEEETNDKVKVMTTFYPLYEATLMVTGNQADVSSIVPLNVEPHSYKPTAQDIINLNSADAYVVLGIEFEAFEEDLIESAKNAKIIEAGKDVPLLEFEDDPHHHEAEEPHDYNDIEEHEEDEIEDHHQYDPHIWLSPKNMKIMVNNIKTALASVDPENIQIYEQNSEESLEKLDELDEKFKASLGNCEKYVILVNHNAFSYLGNEYGFEVLSIAGLSPESEPTSKQIKELIDVADMHELKYVFYEEKVDPRIAETIASEIDAEVLELSPVGGETRDYFKLMEDNLANLKVALRCS